MVSIFCFADDKHIPMYRIVWVSDVPHFCGHEDCSREGQYEIHLEQDESVWATREDRDEVLKSLEAWRGGLGKQEDWD